MHTSSRPEARRTTAANLVLLIFAACSSLLLAEVILRLLAKPDPIISGWRSERPASERNRLGFRGQKIEYSDGDSVVLLVGDSQVEAMACAYDRMPERRLQEYLNRTADQRVKVFTLGARGYGQDQQLLVLEEYFHSYRADLVVLWFTPGNDIWNNIFPTHWSSNGVPKPTFWLESNELAGPSEGMGEPVAESRSRVLASWRRVFSELDRDGRWESLLPPAYSPLAEYRGPVNRLWQERWDRDLGGMRDENLATEKSHLALGLTPRSRRMSYGLELTRRLLLRIDSLVRGQGGEFLVFRTSKPFERQDSPSDREIVRVLNGEYFRTSTRQIEENLGEIFRGFTLLTVAITTDDWRVGPGNAHLNERATDQVMRDLAEELGSVVRSRPR